MGKLEMFAKRNQKKSMVGIYEMLLFTSKPYEFYLLSLSITWVSMRVAWIWGV